MRYAIQAKPESRASPCPRLHLLRPPETRTRRCAYDESHEKDAQSGDERAVLECAGSLTLLDSDMALIERQKTMGGASIAKTKVPVQFSWKAGRTFRSDCSRASMMPPYIGVFQSVL